MESAVLQAWCRKASFGQLWCCACVGLHLGVCISCTLGIGPRDLVTFDFLCLFRGSWKDQAYVFWFKDSVYKDTCRMHNQSLVLAHQTALSLSYASVSTTTRSSGQRERAGGGTSSRLPSIAPSARSQVGRDLTGERRRGSTCSCICIRPTRQAPIVVGSYSAFCAPWKAYYAAIPSARFAIRRPYAVLRTQYPTA